ncbi:hypothetical protein Q4R46_19505, partial [Morganella morganii]
NVVDITTDNLLFLMTKEQMMPHVIADITIESICDIGAKSVSLPPKFKNLIMMFVSGRPSSSHPKY